MAKVNKSMASSAVELEYKRLFVIPSELKSTCLSRRSQNL